MGFLPFQELKVAAAAPMAWPACPSGVEAGAGVYSPLQQWLLLPYSLPKILDPPMMMAKGIHLLGSGVKEKNTISSLSFSPPAGVLLYIQKKQI